MPKLTKKTALKQEDNFINSDNDGKTGAKLQIINYKR